MEPNIQTHRTRLEAEIRQRGRTKSLFALAMDLSIPYPQAYRHLKWLQETGRVEVIQYCPGYPLIITWKGNNHD